MEPHVVSLTHAPDESVWIVVDTRILHVIVNCRNIPTALLDRFVVTGLCTLKSLRDSQRLRVARWRAGEIGVHSLA